MVSQIYIKDIQMFINEAYSDNEPLQDNQIRSKKVFNDYCNKIKQDLERLEELEKENQELKKPKFDLSLLDNAKKIEVDYNEKLLEKIKILEKENKKLKKKNKILSHNSTNIVMTDTKVMKRNLELQTENEKLKKIIKDYCYIDNFPEGEVIRMCCESYEESNREDFEFLNEVFGDEIHK